MKHSEIFRETPRSDEESVELRKKQLEINGLGDKPKGYFSCDKCLSMSICRLAFDAYNVAGDFCLAEK
jgi:hypothetical protein